MSELKKLRVSKNLTQQQVADMFGVSLRSYKSYENDESKKDTIKYNYFVEQLNLVNPVDEEHGILEIQNIIDECGSVFENYDVEFCYLFGSYAKGRATETSDVDLLICTDERGLKFFGLVEDLRNALNKKIDALDIKQLNNNPELLREILRDGIKIYG